MAPAEELVNYALANRPELLESELNLRNGEINNKAAKNALLPTLDLVGYYGTLGLNNNYGDVYSNIVNRTNVDKGGVRIAFDTAAQPLGDRRTRSAQSWNTGRTC